MFQQTYTFAAGCIWNGTKGPICGFSHPCSGVHFIVSIWSVKCFPNPSSFTGGFFLSSLGPAKVVSSLDLKIKSWFSFDVVINKEHFTPNLCMYHNLTIFTYLKFQLEMLYMWKIFVVWSNDVGEFWLPSLTFRHISTNVWNSCCSWWYLHMNKWKSFC